MLRLFKGTGPGVILLIVVLLGGLWASAFMDPQMPGQEPFETSPMPLYGIVQSIIGNHPLSGVIFTFLILSVMLFLLVNFNTIVFFINERTFLPAVIYLLFSAIFPEMQVLNPVLPAALFLLLAFIRIMDAYRKPGIAFNFFDAALLISIGSLFYANLIWFGLLVIIGIALLRTGNIKEIAVCLTGLAVPYILTFGLYYVLGKDIGTFLTDIRDNLFGENAGYAFTRLSVIILILLGLIILTSIVYLMMQLNSKKIKTRKTFYLLLWSFVIPLILYLVLSSVSVELIWITGIPAAYFLAHYFVFERKKLVPEIMFTGLLVLILLLQLLTII
ncbi:MAG: DUF6427 family protein [Bacteroidales bacterium]|jgi:hypothetical protein|nr:DUF6427 family protein [Bacteroidales bacterium]